jgi:transcriptional regulator with PAS, ATPase and Fis domain
MYDRERELIIDKIPDAILCASAEKKIIFLNKDMEAALCKPKDMLAGKSVSEVIRAISASSDLRYNLDEGVKARITLNGKEYFYSLAVIKNFDVQQYMFTFSPAKKIREIPSEINYKKYGFVAKYTFDDFFGESEEIDALKTRARLFARNDMTILIFGESGTGKEILAQAIHNASQRHDSPFLAVNFAAFPESLVESELFGYEGGAFTGARKEGKPGYFEMANGGTIFIDEIGDMPLFMQTRLLRILQERELVKIGGTRVVPIDVRIVAATNVDLKQQILDKKFRQDLYFRLNVLSLGTIPLRQHKNSIDSIINTYFRNKYESSIRLDEAAARLLSLYDWPGNVRELLNAADYIFYSSEGRETIGVKYIPPYIVQEVNNKAAILQDNAKPHLPRREFYGAILQILHTRREKPPGRNSMLTILEEKGLPITEHYLKIMLSEMQAEGFIESGSTRQGTHITEKGRMFFEHL